MASKLIPLLVGLVLGALAATVLLRRSPDGPSQPASAPSTAAIQEDHPELEQARRRIAELEATNLQLADRVQTALRQNRPAQAESAEPGAPSAEEKVLSAFAGNSGDNPARDAAMKEMIKTAMQQQVEGKIAKMQERLNLTPEQAAKAREILEGQFSKGLEIAQKAMSGKATPEDAEGAGAGSFNPEEQIKALLSPEQQAGYEELQKEELRTTARLMANSELLQMQGSLGLSEAQQDQAFQILSEEAERQFGGVSGAPASLDLRANYTRKLEALKQVLTPEQHERYARLQEQQLKLIESMMPKGGPPGDIAVPQVQVLPAP